MCFKQENKENQNELNVEEEKGKEELTFPREMAMMSSLSHTIPSVY